MDDQTEISSTTPSYGFQDEDGAEQHVNSLMDEAADFLSREAVPHVPDEEDILDLAGGAKDAIERHRSTLPRAEEPLRDLKEEPEPSSLSLSTFDRPEPEAVKPAPKPTKVEEKEEKTTVATCKTKSSCKYKM